jgi:hypothetical protein
MAFAGMSLSGSNRARIFFLQLRAYGTNRLCAGFAPFGSFTSKLSANWSPRWLR